MINFAKNDEFLTIIITVPFIPDKDGLSDKEELGTQVKHDITAFVKKKLNAGEDLWTKANAWKEFNDMIVVEGTSSSDCKIYAKMYDYSSNPVLNDTDFDGMDDNADGRPKENKFQGMAKIERNQNLKVDYHNDYRHFYIDNNKYNSELAEMSLMISNIANDEERKLNIYQGGVQVGMMNTGGVLIGDMTIEDYLEKIGFISLATMSLSNGKAYLSYKIVNYYGKEKLIFGIFIGGFDDEESYIKFITDTNNMHQNYEQVVNSIANKIDNLKNLDLIKHYQNGQNYCYFITGKGIAGAVAAEVATKLGDTHNIYCYTFGVPNIKSLPTLLYIKNIVNEDDLLTKIHSDIGQDGDVYNKSIYWDLISEYRHYVESPNRYKGNYKKTNAIRDNLEDIKRSMGWSGETRETFIRELSEYLYSQIGGRIVPLQNEIFHDSRDYSNANNEIEERLVEIEEFTDTLTTANSTKAYWCLVKVLDGYDSEKKAYTETMVYAFTTSEEVKEDSSMVQALKDIAKWYVNNVATYQGRLQTIPLYQYKGNFTNLSKYHFENNRGTGGDKYVMTTTEQSDAIENIDLTPQELNTFLKTIYTMHKNGQLKTEEQKALYLNDFSKQDILRANEKQSKNYREKYPKDTSNVNENTEIKLGNIYYYPDCEFLNKFSSYKRPGDDCTRFAFAVLEKGTGEEARNLGNLSREAIQFIDDDDIGGTIEKMSIYFDIYVGNDFINEFRNGLKTGDMLVGIDGDGDNDRNHCEFIYKDGSANQHVYDVFGWGQVKYTDKSQANFVEDGNKLKNTYDGDYLYSALYRKKVQ